MFRISLCDQWMRMQDPKTTHVVSMTTRPHLMPINDLAEDFVRYDMSRANSIFGPLYVGHGLAWDVDADRYRLAFRFVTIEDEPAILKLIHVAYNNWLDEFIAEAEKALATVSS